MFFVKSKEKEMQKRLGKILDTAQHIIEDSKRYSIDCAVHPIYKYINAIGSTILQKLLMQLFTGQEVDPSDTLFLDLCYYEIPMNDRENMDNRERTNITLKDNLVIPVAWNISRFENALISIGTECGNPFEFQKTNHMTKLFLPIGVTLVYNGNHSILSGILKREGEIYPTEIVNITSLYETIKFDGTYYRYIKGDKIIHKVSNFELGAIYEIGRLIMDNGISYSLTQDTR